MARSTFVYVTYIRTTPERLWSALTDDVEFMKQYWFGVHCESRWKAGSSWTMVHPDGSVSDSGEIVEAEPPRRLVIRWRHQNKPELPPGRSARPPLLCLHPSPLSGLVYDRWLVEIGRDRLALAPDTPGYGSSAAPPQPPAIGDYADAMHRFIDEIGLREVDLMGYHTGSLTSVEFARR